MTCIVGIEYDGGVILGGDSAGVCGWSITPRADEKVFTRTGPDGTEWGFGFCGSFRLGQVVRYRLELPDVHEVYDDDLDAYMVVEFVDALRKCLADAGTKREQYEVESQAGSFFVALRGRLYCVESDFQVGRSRFPFHAIGCGDDLAKGAIHALYHVADVDVGVIANAALVATAEQNGGVCEPFEFVTVGA